MAPRLSQRSIQEIERRIDEMYQRLLTRLLGGYFSGKSLFVQVKSDLSIPALFAAAASEEGGTVDPDLLYNLAGVVKNLVDKQKADSKAITVRRVQMLLADVHAGRIEPESLRSHVEAEMIETWDRIASSVERVVNSESQHAVTLGLKEGLETMNAARGIEDPVVVFVPKIDNATCEECIRVHLMSDKRTPRCWLHSEVSSDYHHKGEDFPSWHLMHPNCRCTAGTILPGFGYDGNGRVAFIKDGFLELEYQRKAGSEGGVDARRAWTG